MGIENTGGRWHRRSAQVLDFLSIWERKRSDSGTDLPGMLRETARKYPQMGSRDRKEWSDGVYQAMRAKRYLPDESWERCLAEGLADCYGNEHPWVDALRANLGMENQTLDAAQRLGSFGFPGAEWVSPRLNQDAFFRAQGRAGKAWIRVDASKWPALLEQIAERSWPEPERFDSKVKGPYGTASLPLGLALHTLPAFADAWFEMQDWSCQMLVELFPQHAQGRWLDACAGAGGKTLLLHQAFPSLQWFVTDARLCRNCPAVSKKPAGGITPGPWWIGPRFLPLIWGLFPSDLTGFCWMHHALVQARGATNPRNSCCLRLIRNRWQRSRPSSSADSGVASNPVVSWSTQLVRCMLPKTKA